jgi:hypothetical protein
MLVCSVMMKYTKILLYEIMQRYAGASPQLALSIGSLSRNNVVVTPCGKGMPRVVSVVQVWGCVTALPLASVLEYPAADAPTN